MFNFLAIRILLNSILKNFISISNDHQLFKQYLLIIAVSRAF